MSVISFGDDAFWSWTRSRSAASRAAGGDAARTAGRQPPGTVFVIDTKTRRVVATVNVGGNPRAIAITNDGDSFDNDETAYVTRLYAELITGPGEGRDQGKQGVVSSISLADVATGGPGESPSPRSRIPASPEPHALLGHARRHRERDGERHVLPRSGFGRDQRSHHRPSGRPEPALLGIIRNNASSRASQPR